MTHSSKNLIMISLAALALSAIAAPAAPAAKFTASAYPASFTSASVLGNVVVGTEVGQVECSDHYQGSMTAPSETLTATWTLSGCKWFSFQWQVNMNGCDVRFRPSGGSGDSFTAWTDIVCPAGKSIEVNFAGCSFNYPPQTGLSSVDFTNNTASKDLSIQATVTGMKLVVTTDDLGCPFAGVGEKTGNTYRYVNPITLDGVVNLDIG